MSGAEKTSEERRAAILMKPEFLQEEAEAAEESRGDWNFSAYSAISCEMEWDCLTES
jgi:hypothetical protein